MSTIKLSVPRSGGVLLTYRCSARCRHCMYASSPEWEADWIGEEELSRGLSALSETISSSPAGPDRIALNHGLHFTGGEPFLNYRLLCRATEMAEDRGVPSTFVETNCFWCTGDKKTRRWLTNLKELGLKGILISVNPFYAEYVPFNRTRRCARVSREVFGPNTVIYQESYYRQFQSMDLKGTMPLESYLERTGTEALTRGAEMFLMGRAARTLRDYYPHYPAETFYHERCRPPVHREWHNHFDNYGNYLPGYCGGVSLGNWFQLEKTLQKGVDPEEKPVLAALLREDMETLVNLACQRGYVLREEGYVSRCDLCIDARKHLAECGGFEELRPREFYRQLD